MSGFANGESSDTELPVSVMHFSIYQGLTRKKNPQPNLGNSRATISKEQGGILNLISIP